MREVKLKAKVSCVDYYTYFEFGAVQADLAISSTGKAARALKLKAGDKVEVTIRKV